MSCSPATTCAAVTTRSPRTNQPLPSTPIPHAFPSTRTTDRLARRTFAFPTIRPFGGVLGGAGPVIDGNGSMRASRWSSRFGGDRLVEAPDDRRAAARRGAGGTARGRAAPSRRAPRRGRRRSPMPSTSPPTESRNRNGVSRRPPRTNEPAIVAAVWTSTPPMTAPTSPASAAHGELAPPCRRCGATREPTYAPAGEPGERQRADDEPAPHPGERAQGDERERDPVDGIQRARAQTVADTGRRRRYNRASPGA